MIQRGISQRRPHLPATLIGLTLLAAGAALVAAEEPGQQQPGPQETVLFAFDDENMAWRHNLRLTLARPEKHPANPVLRCGPKGSPDYGHAILYGTVLYEGGRFRMWYLGMIQRELEAGQAPGWWRPMCYAESRDGIHWTKPELGLVELGGNTRNNICRIEGVVASMTLVNDFLSVLCDGADPNPARRYKAAYIAHMPAGDIRGGMSRVGTAEGRVGAMICATSPDGLRWTVVGDRPANAGGERFEVSSLYRFGNFYYASGQLIAPWAWLADGRTVGRMMQTYRSVDFVHWSTSKATSMLLPEQQLGTDLSVNDLHAGLGKQMHMGVGVWNRGNVLVGVHGLWRGVPQDRFKTAKGLDGLRIDLGLSISNDGVHFREPVAGFALLEHGKPGQWDSIALLQGHAFANVGEKTYLWYSHWDAEERFRSQEIGLATLRRDGFGCLTRHAPGSTGECVTTVLPTSARGDRVWVNVDGVTAASPLRIELVDDRDRPVAGYCGADAALIAQPGLRQAVAWAGGHRTTLPADRPAALRIRWPDSEAARLYAVYIAAPQSPRSESHWRAR